MSKMKCDFSGYVTRYDVLCTDGRTIRKDSFKHCDGKKVPLTFQHAKDDPNNVIGHTYLEHRDDGVYGYSVLNKSPNGQQCKILVENGDIEAYSIRANHLKERAGQVFHGDLFETSLVYAGANRGAKIDYVELAHGEDGEGEAIIQSGEFLFPFEDEFEHADDSEPEVEHADEGEEMIDETNTEVLEHEDAEGEQNDESGETLADVFNTLNEKQKNLLYFMLAQAAGTDIKHDNGGNEMNVFEQNGKNELAHGIFDSREQNEILHSAMQDETHSLKKYFENAALEHADGDTPVAGVDYGIANVDYLFPDMALVGDMPGMIARDQGWVTVVMNETGKVPFSRIKSIFANITAAEARAKGYITGNKKKEEVFALLKRETSPTTVYKKQKLDRDTIVDITTIDVVAFLKKEMQFMLREELATAAIYSDGRSADAEDKISETCIRPVAKETNGVYASRIALTVDSTDYAKVIDDIASSYRNASQGNYLPAAKPTALMQSSLLSKLITLRDAVGHRLYKNADDIAREMNVDKIVEVPDTIVERGTIVSSSEGTSYAHLPLVVLVNLPSYKFGSVNAGKTAFFDDFDIDFNQYKYLYETRTCGALVDPYSAVVYESLTEVETDDDTE